MKKIIGLTVLVLSLVQCGQAQKTAFSKESLSEKLSDTNQQNHTFQQILDKHKGKTTVIEVWASWCGDCVKAMPHLKEQQAAHPEVSYVFISMDKAFDKWIGGIEKQELKGDHYWAADGMKGAFGKAIDLDWIPRYIILDKNGKIITYRAIEKDFEAMEQTLNKLKS